MDVDKTRIKQLVLELIHSETGWAASFEPKSTFEELDIHKISPLQGNLLLVVFKYILDEDGFSQYDKTHRLEGEVIFDVNDEIISFTLNEVHTGVACKLEPYG